MEIKEKIQKIKFLSYEDIDVVILEEQEDNILFFVETGYGGLETLKYENNLRLEKTEDYIVFNNYNLKGYIYKSKSLGDVYLYEVSFKGDVYDLYVALGSLKKLSYSELEYMLKLFFLSEEFTTFNIVNPSV
jgi:hypothetical protein